MMNRGAPFLAQFRFRIAIRYDPTLLAITPMSSQCAGSPVARFFFVIQGDLPPSIFPSAESCLANGLFVIHARSHGSGGDRVPARDPSTPADRGGNPLWGTHSVGVADDAARLPAEGHRVLVFPALGRRPYDRPDPRGVARSRAGCGRAGPEGLSWDRGFPVAQRSRHRGPGVPRLRRRQ